MLLVPEQTVAAPVIVPATDVGLTIAAIVATFWVVAPDEAQVMLPAAPLTVVVDKRTYIIVLNTTPVAGAILTFELNPVPEVNETSYPVGAVTIKLAVKPVAETVKFCSADTEPIQAEKTARVPVAFTIGITQSSVGKLSVIVFETPQVGSV